MSTPNTSPEGSSPVAPSGPSTSPEAVFPQDSTAPHWVQEAGLTAAHQAAKPPEPTTPVQTAAPVQPGVTTQPVAPVQPVGPTTPVAPAPFDQEALARSIAEGVRQGNAPQPTGPSDADLSRQLGIVTVTPEMYKSVTGVDGTPEQVRAFNDFGQAVAKQAVTIASLMLTQQIKTMQDSLSPYTSAVRAQEAVRQKETFFKEAPELAGYEELVKQQYQIALQSGRKFATVDDARKFVADQTRSTLKTLGITPAVPAAHGSNQPTGKPAPQSRQMAPTSLGGKGSGASGPATQPATTNQAVWG